MLFFNFSTSLIEKSKLQHFYQQKYSISIFFLILSMLGIREAFTTATRTLNFGVQGYHVEKKYFDPKNESFSKQKQTKKKETKKGSYLDDYVAIHGRIPGPGVYDFSVTGSTFGKKNHKKINYPDKKTIFDQMCEKQIKEKRPAPGQYQPKKNQRPQSASVRRPKVIDRFTFLDAVQYESSVTPGVGAYNPRPQSANVGRKDRMKPEDWIEKHKRQQKTNSKTKQPTPFTYDPESIGKKSFSKLRKGNSTWGCIDRFKDSKSKLCLGPGKYAGHCEWGKPVCYGNQSPAGSVYYR